eukprot:scaffold37279_cov69-Phaeocystis_antarctica.AAC.3
MDWIKFVIFSDTELLLTYEQKRCRTANSEARAVLANAQISARAAPGRAAAARCSDLLPAAAKRSRSSTTWRTTTLAAGWRSARLTSGSGSMMTASRRPSGRRTAAPSGGYPGRTPNLHLGGAGRHGGVHAGQQRRVEVGTRASGLERLGQPRDLCAEAVGTAPGELQRRPQGAAARGTRRDGPRGLGADRRVRGRRRQGAGRRRAAVRGVEPFAHGAADAGDRHVGRLGHPVEAAGEQRRYSQLGARARLRLGAGLEQAAARRHLRAARPARRECRLGGAAAGFPDCLGRGASGVALRGSASAA